MQTKWRLTVLALVACVFALRGTAHEPVDECLIWDALPSTHHVSPYCSTLTPRRIVIVTCVDRQDRLKEQQQLAESLATHVAGNRKFSVVVCKTPMCRDHLPMHSGTFDELQLLRLSKKYHADCVLYCDVERIDAYQPMQADLSMLLVHVGEAVALVSAKSSYDLRDPDALKAYRQYINADNPESALSVDQHTPRQFIDFAANHLANGILSLW
jgi:hypothetical protein